MMGQGSYHLNAPIFETPYPEYFATEVLQITHIGPVSRVVFGSAKIGIESGRANREVVCAVVIPTEMLNALMLHLKTGIPPQAHSAVTGWEERGTH